MKKRVLSGLFALALLVAVGYGVSENLKSNTGLSDLVLINVEALADGESGGTPVRSCYEGKIYEDPGSPNTIQGCNPDTSPTMIYPCPPGVRGYIYGYSYSHCTT